MIATLAVFKLHEELSKGTKDDKQGQKRTRRHCDQERSSQQTEHRVSKSWP